MRDTEREREAETQTEGEAGSMHREPDVGLDPRSPGSRPGPKAGAKPLRHRGCPGSVFINVRLSLINWTGLKPVLAATFYHGQRKIEAFHP